MTQDEASKLVRRLRARFTDVTTTNDKRGDSKYCIGGVLLHEVFHPRSDIYKEGVNKRFPCITEIASALLVLNPNLEAFGGRGAYTNASEITRRNDAGEFDAAWQTVIDALTWEELFPIKGGR